MYATAHRVRSALGEEGINVFLHRHGGDMPWPADPWTLPETQPGEIVLKTEAIPPGGNQVRSYLDVIAPDNSSPDALEAALTSLWLQLVADEAAVGSPLGRLPNPIVFRSGPIVLRFSVEPGVEEGRALEMAALHGAIGRVLQEARAHP